MIDVGEALGSRRFGVGEESCGYWEHYTGVWLHSETGSRRCRGGRGESRCFPVLCLRAVCLA